MTAPLPHRHDVDGLRGVAVALVLAFHGWPALVPGGFIGVDVFFVISGFVVARLVARELADGAFSARRFFTRRVNRLAPALLLTLTSTLVVGAAVLSPSLLALLVTQAASALALSANVFDALQAGYFDPSAEVKPLLHLWSLSVEEQFYLLVPLAVAVTARLGRARGVLLWAVTLGSFAACVWLTQRSAQWAYFLPVTRAWELLVGVLLARMQRALPAPVALVGLGAIVGAALWLDGATPFPGLAALLPVLGAAVIISSGPTGPLARALSSRPLVALGLVSYPLYLWHWPVLVIGRLATPRSAHGWVTPLLVLASVLLAVATARFVERPVRRRSSTRIAAALVGLSVALAVGLGVLIARATPETWAFRDPLAAEVMRFEHGYDFKADARWGTCWLLDDVRGVVDASCVEREPAAAPLVYVWGDSYAARLTAGLRQVQHERPTFRLAQRTRASCPPLYGHGSPVCRDANAEVMAELREVKPDFLVLHARWNGVPLAITETLVALRGMLPGTRLVVLGQPPEWPSGLAWALSRRVGGETVPLRLEPEGFSRQRDDEAKLRALTTTQQATFVSGLDALCDQQQQCLVRTSLSPLMLSSWDYGHLTTPAAKTLGRWLAAELRW